MLAHVIQVVSGDKGEALLQVEGQVVAGDKMEAPSAQLRGIVQLSGQQKTWRGRAENYIIWPSLIIGATTDWLWTQIFFKWRHC